MPETDRHTDTHGHTSRTLTRPVTQTTAEKALPSTAPAYRTLIKHKHRQPSLLLLLGWQRQEVTSVGTYMTLFRFTITHTFVVPSSTGKAPLSTWHPCLHPSPLSHPRVPFSPAGPARCSLYTHSTHTLIPQALHNHRSPRYQHGPSTQLIPWPRPEAPLLVSWSNLRFASEYTCTPPAHQDWGR